jgi:hypothetical protein
MLVWAGLSMAIRRAWRRIAGETMEASTDTNVEPELAAVAGGATECAPVST